MGFPSRRTVLSGIATAAAGLLSGCTTTKGESAGHLFVENRTEEPHRIAIRVNETGDDGSPLVSGMYRVPAEIALQFEGVLETGTEYRIRAIQPDAAGPERLERTTFQATTCTENDDAERMDISVLATNGGPDITVFECDRTYRFLDELEYVDPSEHRTGTVTETIGPPTSVAPTTSG